MSLKFIIRKVWLTIVVLWGIFWMIPMTIFRLGFSACYGIANLSIKEGLDAWKWTA